MSNQLPGNTYVCVRAYVRTYVFLLHVIDENSIAGWCGSGKDSIAIKGLLVLILATTYDAGWGELSTHGSQFAQPQ